MNDAADQDRRALFGTSTDALRHAAYRAGHSDRQIARMAGVSQPSITNWRRRRGLPAHSNFGPVDTPETVRRLYVEIGMRDCQIAEAIGINQSCVTRWRNRRGLRPGGGIKNDPFRALFDIVTRAVGHNLPRDIRDEAIGDLCVMALEGRVTLAQIKDGAAKARSSAFSTFASKWGARSIDEDLTGDGFALVDTLVDSGHSQWLEEMGATAW